MTVHKLDLEPRFASILDVNSVLELGYASHASRDETLKGTKVAQLADKLMDDFLAMKAPAGTIDEAYLFKVRALVLALGNGVSRRKALYKEDLALATRYRDTELTRIDNSRRQSFWTNVVWRAVVSGGIGFALMESLLPFIHVAGGGGRATAPAFDASLAPSFLLALVFVAGSKVVFSTLNDMRFQRIFQHYEWLRLYAQKHYENGKLKEFERTHQEVRRLWQEYTGRKPTDCVTFASVLIEDIRTQEQMERARQRLSTNFMMRLLLKFQAWRKRAAKEREKGAHGRPVSREAS